MRLSLVDCLQYIGGSTNSRCVYEGEEVLNAGHIILLAKINTSDENKLHLCALCLQTSALASNPHEIKGTLLTSGEKVTVADIYCTCKAGLSAKCKHISAVLIKCTRCKMSTILKGVIMPRRLIFRTEYVLI